MNARPVSSRSKSPFAALVALVLLAAPATPASAQVAGGAGTTAALTLAAFVPPVLSLSMAPVPSSVWRALATSPHEDIEIAHVVEVNNYFGTYRLTISSANAGALVMPGAAAPVTASGTVPYTVTYNDTALDLHSGQSVVPGVSGNPRESGTTTVHVLKIRIDPSATVPAGAIAGGHLQDTITFSVAAP